MAAAEDADDIAINFVPLNTKSARKKLLKCLLSVPRNRCDLLPLYARLIATLNQILPNLGADVICVVSIVGPDTSQSEVVQPMYIPY